MGTEDVPAFIDKIVEITAQPKVTYIGYDQGNTQIFYGLTQKPSLASRINKVIALAPCVFYNRLTMPEPYHEAIGGLRKKLKIYGINGPDW